MKRVRRVLQAVEDALTIRLGAQHVAGPAVADAILVAREEAARGHWTTLGYAARPNDTPASIAAHYLDNIEALAQSRLESYVSIKADLLGADRALLVSILERARQRNVRVHFDANTYAAADATLAGLEAGLKAGARVSGTLVARWKRSEQDAERLLAAGVPIRIVRGQTTDPFHREAATNARAAYLALVRRLAGRATHVAIATHDRRIAAPALDLLKAAGTPCSLEQLLEVPRIEAVADARGVPVRVYIAYGNAGLPYSIHQLRERPAIIWWVLRDLLRARRGSRRA